MPFLAQLVHTTVVGNSVEPGVEWDVGSQLWQSKIELQKDMLQDIFCEFLIL